MGRAHEMRHELNLPWNIWDDFGSHSTDGEAESIEICSSDSDFDALKGAGKRESFESVNPPNDTQ